MKNKPGLHGRFVLITEAAGAKGKLFLLAVNHKRGGMNVSYPAPVGVAFGMADIRTIHWNFSAYIALQCSKSPLVTRYGFLQNLPIHSNIVR